MKYMSFVLATQKRIGYKLRIYISCSSKSNRVLFGARQIHVIMPGFPSIPSIEIYNHTMEFRGLPEFHDRALRVDQTAEPQWIFQRRNKTKL
jgi:hypothetical protein